MSIFDEAEKAIDAYVTSTLTTRQRIAIKVCNADLYYGPNYSKSGYSRWETWSPVLAEALDDLPRELWYDAMSGEVLEREPKVEELEYIECIECPANGTDAPCPVCNGTGFERLEPFWEDFYCFDTHAIKSAVLGKELASCF
ncbi:MAG: hypothetical protein MN733_21295 [Nitrososphaera sp.]|nr:hypothetical protein [Nitrososphaera sp.]